MEEKDTNIPREDASSGQDSLAKALRRNLNPKKALGLLQWAGSTLAEEGFQGLGRGLAYRWQLATHGEYWRHHADRPLKRELRWQRACQPDYRPLVSLVSPLYNTPLPFLRQMVESVLAQSYTHFELILVDASDEAHSEVGRAALGFAKKDARVRYARLPENRGIAGNTNAGLALAKGEWLSLLDHDDLLAPQALYALVSACDEALSQPPLYPIHGPMHGLPTHGVPTHGQAPVMPDLVFSDEVVLDSSLKKLGAFHFKPDYGPDTLRGCNYMTHFCAFTRTLLNAAGGSATGNHGSATGNHGSATGDHGSTTGSGSATAAGEDPAFDGAQDYDLILRLTEKARRIHHIPQVLYYWRQGQGSTAADIANKPYAIEAGARAIAAHLARVGLAGTVEHQDAFPGSYRVRYAVQGKPLVSVIIPNKDHIDDLDRCLVSLYEKGGWEAMEIIVVENNSADPATEAYYAEAQTRFPALRVERWEGPFNFSAICNFGAGFAKGDQLLLLNNDIELITDGFLPELLAYSQRPDVGAVGALLWYPPPIREVQHAGLFIGIGGTAGVSHKGHPMGSGGDLFRLCTTQNTSAVTGACLMVKRALYQALKGLNEEDFAVAFNDVDFCLRLREQGLWNVFTPFAQAWHYESKSRGLDTKGPQKERFQREAAAFRARHSAILEAGDPFYNPHFSLEYENLALR